MTLDPARALLAPGIECHRRFFERWRRDDVCPITIAGQPITEIGVLGTLYMCHEMRALRSARALLGHEWDVKRTRSKAIEFIREIRAILANVE
jgi:hypothetical protein